MYEKIFFAYAIAQLHNFGTKAIHANTFVALFAKNQWGSILQVKDVIISNIWIGGVIPGRLIENDTILVNFDKSRAPVLGGLFEHLTQVFGIGILGAGNESCLDSKGDGQGIERIINRSHRS